MRWTLPPKKTTVRKIERWDEKQCCQSFALLAAPERTRLQHLEPPVHARFRMVRDQAGKGIVAATDGGEYPFDRLGWPKLYGPRSDNHI